MSDTPTSPTSAGRNLDRPPSRRPRVSELIAWRDAQVAAVTPAPADIPGLHDVLPNLDDPDLTDTERSAALARYRALRA